MASTAAINRLRGPEWIDALEQLCRKYVTVADTLVEIGSFGGESTEVFSRHAGSVFAVDPWDSSYAEMVLNGCADGPIKDFVMSVGLAPMSEVEALFDSRTAGSRNVRKIKAFDTEAVHLFEDGSIDFLYIDSIHTYDVVHSTILRWQHKIKAGGSMPFRVELDFTPDAG